MQVTVAQRRRAVTPSKDTFTRVNINFLIPQEMNFLTTVCYNDCLL